jgi:hypothetical protein
MRIPARPLSFALTTGRHTGLEKSAGSGFMRGPMVDITDEELFDIAEAVHQTLWRG